MAEREGHRMSTTTTNFGWTIPSDTDLVTDGAAAMRALGNGIDASFPDLKGGTTGQILAKASATDLDFSWITNDIGDITAVNVTSPITGGGTSGAVTIAIQDASTTQKGAVQLSSSTSSTSTTLAATPSAVKTAYDLAVAAVTTTGVETLTNKTLTSPTINAPIITYSINTQTGTTYTVTAADAGAFITTSNASANALKIPTDAGANIAVGSSIQVMNLGAGTLTISAVTPATTTIVSSAATSASPTVKTNKIAQLIKIAANSWVAYGAIE